MTHRPSGKPFRRGVLILLVAAGLISCSGESPSPQPVAAWSFDRLVAGEPVAVQISEPKTPLLLVRVDGFETAIESRVRDPGGVIRSAVRLPYLRTAPAFHVIGADVSDGPWEVSITPVHLNRDARIDVRVYELPERSRRDDVRIQAFRDYAGAVQSTDDESEAEWNARLELMRSAARGLARARNAEEALWARFLAAYFEYFPLARYPSAIAEAQEIQAEAIRAGHSRIELMALQLEGQALIERSEDDRAERARAKQVRAQEVLERAARIANRLETPFEQAWALNSRGMGYFYQDQYEPAAAYYREALELAVETGDSYLRRLVLSNLALVHERQGDLEGALTALNAINDQLRSGGTRAELAHNWSELSRLYQRLSLFPESIEAQDQALNIWRELGSAEGVGRSQSSLAHAYLAIGKTDMALTVMLEAIGNMETANYGRGLRDGFGLVADIYRSQARFDEMSAARARQEKYLTSDSHRARFLYALGLDASARSPGQDGLAARYFTEAGSMAAAAGDTGLEIRSRLRRCALAARQSAEGCDVDRLQSEVLEWLPGAPPNLAFESRYLIARVQANLGEMEPAIATMTALADDVGWYRNSLPGVLGAWYWESRSRVFRFLMELHLDRPGSEPDAWRSLLAFNRLLSAERRPAGRSTPVEQASSRRLRSLLAQLTETDGSAQSEVRRAIDRELLDISARREPVAAGLDEAGLDRLLARMPPDSAVLAYFFGDAGAWAWMADRSGIRVARLDDTGESADALARARRGLRVIGNPDRDPDLEEAGELLLAPFGDELPRTIYLISAGNLAGFPFDALKRRGNYLALDHDLVNLLSLDGLRDLQDSAAGAAGWRRVFLAGDPERANADLRGASAEIDSLRQLFGSLDVTVLSGSDLRPGLEQDPRIARADLFHFAGHGEINLEYPELSRLLLSGREGGGSEDYLTPLEIGGVPMNADLVTLSACETTGVNAFQFDSNMGFVSAFLQAGAGAVVASLWPVSDSFARDFMQDFYVLVLRGDDVPGALAEAKRRHLAREASEGTLYWPAFQVYFR